MVDDTADFIAKKRYCDWADDWAILQNSDLSLHQIV